MDNIILLSEFTNENCLTNNVLTKNMDKIFTLFNKKFGCTYFSYVLECTKTRKKIQLSTNAEWAHYFYFKNLIKNCPLAMALRSIHTSKKSSTLVWNNVKPQTKQEKIITGLREDFSATNGILYATFLDNDSFGPYFEVISFGGEKLDLNFYREIHQNKKRISSFLYELRCKGYHLMTKENEKLIPPIPIP